MAYILVDAYHSVYRLFIVGLVVVYLLLQLYAKLTLKLELALIINSFEYGQPGK